MVWISSLGLGGKSLWPFYFHIESTSCWANSFTSPPSWGSTIVIGSRAWDDQMETNNKHVKTFFNRIILRANIENPHIIGNIIITKHLPNRKQLTLWTFWYIREEEKKRSGTVFATFWSSNLSDCPSRLQHFGAQTFHVAWYFATRVHLS